MAMQKRKKGEKTGESWNYYYIAELNTEKLKTSKMFRIIIIIFFCYFYSSAQLIGANEF